MISIIYIKEGERIEILRLMGFIGGFGRMHNITLLLQLLIGELLQRVFIQSGPVPVLSSANFCLQKARKFCNPLPACESFRGILRSLSFFGGSQVRFKREIIYVWMRGTDKKIHLLTAMRSNFSLNFALSQVQVSITSRISFAKLWIWKQRYYIFAAGFSLLKALSVAWNLARRMPPGEQNKGFIVLNVFYLHAARCKWSGKLIYVCTRRWPSSIWRRVVSPPSLPTTRETRLFALSSSDQNSWLDIICKGTRHYLHFKGNMADISGISKRAMTKIWYILVNISFLKYFL